LANYGNLDKYLKEHMYLGYTERLEIVSLVLNGLQELHSKGICHSALKAENILVFKKTAQEKSSRSNRNKNNNNLDIEISLSDFCVIPSFGERRIISPNEFYASYTSPSCIKFPSNGYTFEDDVYSFGLFLWQMAYNETPFIKEFKEINNIKLNNAITSNNYVQKSSENDYSPILPLQNDSSKEMPYEFKKIIEERNCEMKLRESYNQIQQSTHYMDDNYKLNLNRYEVMNHRQNSELLKLNNLIVENQLRPEIGDNIPSKYSNLIIKCWDNQPNKRPDLANIEEEIDHLRNTYYKNKMVSLNYKLSDRQSKSLSRCLNDGNSSSYIHTDNVKQRKTKSVWGMLNNPRNSIMNIINKVGGYTNSHNHRDIRKNVASEDPSRQNLLNQPDIEMEDIQAPEQSYSNVQMGHHENNYTTINIESENDTVIIDTNPSVSFKEEPDYANSSNAQNTSDVNYSYSSQDKDNTILNELEENSMMTKNITLHDNYYSSDDHENNLIYPDLNLDDIEQDSDINSEVLEELGKLNAGKNANEGDINDPLNSKQVNENSHSNHVEANYSFTDSYSDDEDNSNEKFNNYSLAKNYISYNNNKRNTLFAFLETKTSDVTHDTEYDLSSSEDNLNYYDGDIQQIKEKTQSYNSIKDDLKNEERNKSHNSSIDNTGLPINYGENIDFTY